MLVSRVVVRGGAIRFRPPSLKAVERMAEPKQCAFKGVFSRAASIHE